MNGKTVTTEDGKLKNLRFTQDILGIKFDLMGLEIMAAQFLASYFATISKEYDANPSNLYIMITSSDKEVTDLVLAVYEGSGVLKNLKLDEIFGE